MFLRALACLCLALTSCSTVTFYTQAVAGQSEIMLKRKPVAKLIADPHTEAKLREQFHLTQRLLVFARDELAMPSNGSYTLYSDLHREHTVWVVHAAPELSMQAKSWWYPVVGRQEYRGFFSKKLAEQEMALLGKQGYETWGGDVDAFSTLGVFRDPLLNTFILREEMELAELLFHELAHHQYYVSGNTKLNEGMAEAVAREGVRRWFKATRRPNLLARYDLRLQRLSQARHAIGGTVHRLRALYASPRNDDEKRKLKMQEIARLKSQLRKLRGTWGGGLDAWIDQPINNARLNSFIAYEDEVPRFTRMLKNEGGDFAKFWQRIKSERPR